MCNFSRAFQEKNSPQSEFRAKSYARFKEDSRNKGLWWWKLNRIRIGGSVVDGKFFAD
jgi:hypothetical protein